MRLIDADELADYITENEDDFLYALEYKDRGLLETMIALMPIAYDIDKVVEELEKLQKEIFSYAFKYNDDFYSGQASGLSKAIEIVKQGVR